MFKKKSNLILKNYDNFKNKKIKKRHPLAPNIPTNILICGSTGSGKTNLLLNLIYDLLYFDSLYVCAKDLNEEKYQELLQVCEAANKVSPFCFKFYNNSDEMVDINAIDETKQNLIIFDDFICDKKALNIIGEYFIRGRKKNCTSIFLSQSYFATPKIIRLNISHYYFFKSFDDREISEIFKTHSCNMTKESFVKMFKEATNEPYSFLNINKDNQSVTKNLSHFINI